MLDLTNRSTYLGASEVAAAIGWSSHRSPFDVWASKTGVAEEPEAGVAADVGNALESLILDYAERELGPIQRGDIAKPIDGTPIIAHPDGFVMSTGSPVDAKASGIVNPVPNGWRRGSVPIEYRVQSMIQSRACGTDHGWVVVLLGGRGFKCHKVVVDNTVVELILDRVRRFWEHVENKTPPYDLMKDDYWDDFEQESEPNVDDPSTVVTDDGLSDIVAEYLDVCERRRDLEKREAKLKEAILSVVPDDGVKVGELLVLRQVVESRRLDSSAIKRELPDVYERYSAVSKSTRVKIVERKAN